jgi:hypothetical protein
MYFVGTIFFVGAGLKPPLRAYLTPDNKAYRLLTDNERAITMKSSGNILSRFRVPVGKKKKKHEREFS